MTTWQAVRIAGGIVPPSMLARVQAGEVDAASLTPASYHLAGNETLRDAAARAWSYLRGAWTSWRSIDDPTTGQTRERWLLPLMRELGYGNVPALPHGLDVDGTRYPISHARDHVAMHLLGPTIALDRRNPGVAGAARAPQAMVQEFLNRSDDRLWAILANGTRLRLLRDSTALAGSAYLEFDLEAIFDGELYPEFLLLFSLAHSSRTEIRSNGDADEAGPADCWLEVWRTDAVDTGTRALDKLRVGVETALTALGDGFLHHPDNRWLVDALRNGDLTDRDYLRALLRLVYRLLFCFVAEDRGALLDPAADPAAKTRYTDYFATARLRRLSRLRAGGPHPDLWRGQRLVLVALGAHGLPQIAIPALGGLFDPDPRAATVPEQPEPDLLLGADISNHSLLTAVRALAWVEVKGGRLQAVDYRHLGAEELGSVYESLLELIPRVDLADMTFRLEGAAGNDRKTTGSYYTPPALVSALLDTALDPLLDDAVKNADSDDDAERRLLALTVCDPACGSGGFLVAAARRIARRLAQVRSEEDEPTPDQVQHALRDVVGRCIYGVDLNDLAAELAKVSLWLEALEPGKPLGFLDARIRTGNSLIGSTPALLADGIPDAAFKEIAGDDKKYAAAIRKQNKAERAGQYSLFAGEGTFDPAVLARARSVLLAPTDDVAATRAQAAQWQAYEHSQAVRRAHLHADAWAAAFVWPLRPGAVPPVTHDTLTRIAENPDDPTLAATVAEVERLAHEYRFFHWHLEFPEVFGDPGAADVGPDGWPGGFSCLLGNPPWERVKLQEQEFFAARSPEIAKAPNAAARTRLIKALAAEDPTLYEAFLDEKRRAEGASHLLRQSGRYPLNGRGDVNTYSVFAELFRNLTAPHGRSGVIVPTGIATDATTQFFFKDLVTSRSLAALYDFENRAGIFPDVDSRMKFCLLTLTGRADRADAASFAFFLHDPADIDVASFALTPDEITLLNPNTGTCPVFRTRRDAEITLGIYRRVPVLINEAKVAAGDPDGNPWGVSFTRMFDMSNDSNLFRTRAELEADGWTLAGNIFERHFDAATGAVVLVDHVDPGELSAAPSGEALDLDEERIRTDRLLPLYEGKMGNQFDHRFGSFTGSGDTDLEHPVSRDAGMLVLPRYWVAPGAFDVRVQRRQWGTFDAFVGHRRVARNNDERTVIAALLPFVPASYGWILSAGPPPKDLLLLLAIYNSFVYDYAMRNSLSQPSIPQGTSQQIPVPEPAEFQRVARFTGADTLDTWLRPRILELTYTAWDMASFAEDLGDTDPAIGTVNPPFVWDDERRSWVRAELDAAFFHLYDITRDDVDYILDTFPIVRRKDEASHGEYRTKNRILAIYDAMTTATETGQPYLSVLDPPPGHGHRHLRKDA